MSWNVGCFTFQLTSVSFADPTPRSQNSHDQKPLPLWASPERSEAIVPQQGRHKCHHGHRNWDPSNPSVGYFDVVLVVPKIPNR